MSDAEVERLPVLDLHRPPAHLGAKRRFVFCSWPRNPDGPTVRESPKAKAAGNGLPIWGATLYDFYTFERVPSLPNYLTRTSGSRLAAAMREIGELGWAAEEIKWADKEDEPVVVEPSDIGIEIKRAEAAEALVSGRSMPPTAPATTPTIHQKLELQLLPQKLFVHDPWKLLFV
ncbi:hypothetical protein FIBSPDRAFT_743237, partial [Athelia psychrophila]